MTQYKSRVKLRHEEHKMCRYDMRYAIRYGSHECDMRGMGRANAICDMRIRYGPRECEM